MRECERESVCVCVLEYERERENERVCVCVLECERERENERVREAQFVKILEDTAASGTCGIKHGWRVPGRQERTKTLSRYLNKLGPF